MTRILLSAIAATGVLLLANVTCAQTSTAPTAPPAEAPDLTGSWELVGAVMGGVDVLPSLGGTTMKVVGGRYEVLRQGQPSDEGTLRLTPNESVLHLDLESTAARPARAFVGIAKLEGNRVTFCMETNGQARPDSFDTADHPYRMVLVYERR